MFESIRNTRPIRNMRFYTPSWLYPLKGLYYFLTHPHLYPLVRTRFLPAFLLSLFILSNLFLWTYIPQVAFLALFQGLASAWFNGTILVLSEGAAVVAILFECFFVDETMVDIFDAVLVAKGYTDIVETARPVASEVEEADPVKRLGRPRQSSVYAPFSFRQIFEFVVFLPINFIPWVGVPIFLFLTGYRAGPFQHWRYFKLLGLEKKERNRFIKRRHWSYTWFGTVALCLQLVPVLSMMFLMTTAVGSALWACKIEEERRALLPAPRAPEQHAYHDDPPPAYTDQDDPV